MGVSVGRSKTRLFRLVLACLVAFFLFAYVIPSSQPVHAQADAEEGAKTAEKEQPKKHSLFVHMIRSAGYFGPVLLLVSIALVALIVLLAMDLRMGATIPPGFVEDFTDTVNKRRFKEAYELARQDNSYLGRVLTTGMSRLQYGIDDARESAFNLVESIKASKEQLIAYLATIGTLGPMLGLVGTVFGMIESFKVLAEAGQRSPELLAAGISKALVVTLLGIGLSIPAILFHAFFRNRLIRIAMDTSNMADDLLTQMYHNSKKPAPAAADTRSTSSAVKAAE